MYTLSFARAIKQMIRSLDPKWLQNRIYTIRLTIQRFSKPREYSDKKNDLTEIVNEIDNPYHSSKFNEMIKRLFEIMDEPTETEQNQAFLQKFTDQAIK
jgi:hypothetical protein